jgi:pimeloyl-ACP methyl ester carboxylesterase
VESGRALAEKLSAVRPARCALVAHSMGGLVARAALALPGTGHVERVVLLGTPNGGSFAAVQALRGTYAVVRKIARLAPEASAESLAAEIFSTFPSLYELLPAETGTRNTDLLDERSWPASEPRPRAPLLQAARALKGQLAPADQRFAVIAGVGVATVTAVARRGDQFLYTVTRRGDGTVPAASAELPGIRCAYAARVAHSDLTREPRVAAAVADLLLRGTTARLPGRWSSASRARAKVSDRELQRTQVEKVDWGALTPGERRVFLQELNEPPRLRLRVPGTARRAR